MGTNAAAAAASKSSGSFSYILIIVVIFAAFYFLMIRPQQRRRQQAAQQQNTVAPGARVRTTAGMYATVVAVDGDDVILEVAPGIEVRYMKRAVMDVVSPGDPGEDVDAPGPDDESDGEVYDEADSDDVEAEAAESPEDEGTPEDAQAPKDAQTPEDAYEKATGSKKD